MEFFGFKVKMNEEKTKNWYANAEIWSCDCGHCRNFLELARKEALPMPILNVLKKLGISPEKATYVCGINLEKDTILYQFSYRIAGEILNEDEAMVERQNWGECRCCHEPYPYGTPNFPAPHVDLEFWVYLPWGQ